VIEDVPEVVIETDAVDGIVADGPAESLLCGEHNAHLSIGDNAMLRR
jgi:hypothetical protein